MNKNYIKTYDNVVDSGFCDKMIEMFESSKKLQTLSYMEGHYNFTELDVCSHPDEKYKLLRSQFYATIELYKNFYIQDLKLHKTQFPITHGYEMCRIKKYEPEVGMFNPHVDVADYASAKRFLVAFLYLNDVEKGGGTWFPDYNIKVAPKKGKLLMFPSTWSYLHAGAPPISNPKYIMGTYLHYT